MKITFLGAGSTIFAKNVLGDVMLTPALQEIEIALYDIDADRLEESFLLIENLNARLNENRASVKKYLGVENRKEALRGANFIVNAIQVGGYEPCTVIDFEIPKKYGLRQTIADTLGIGGIFRGLRTIKVMQEFANDIEEVCPDALFLNYTNPMAILSGYMQRYTGVKTVGLCHSVQGCAREILTHTGLEDKIAGHIEKIAGINHMAWLLEIKDKDGNDLYPEIRRRAKEILNGTRDYDLVRLDYIDKFGYYCTESSEHNAEYSALYIKPNRDDLIEKFKIPLDEYPRRCVNQIEYWQKQKVKISEDPNWIEHKRTWEYASHIMEAVVTNKPYIFGGNVINNGVIPNLPAEACVEVSCVASNRGIIPTYAGPLPTQLAAMNSLNIYPQLLTIEAARTKSKETLYHAALVEPHTAAELSTDEIISLCDDLMEAHEKSGFKIL